MWTWRIREVSHLSRSHREKVWSFDMNTVLSDAKVSKSPPGTMRTWVEKVYMDAPGRPLRGQVESRGGDVRQVQRAKEGVDRDWKEAGSSEILFDHDSRERGSLETDSLVPACHQKPSVRALGKSTLDPERAAEIFVSYNYPCFTEMRATRCGFLGPGPGIPRALEVWATWDLWGLNLQDSGVFLAADLHVWESLVPRAAQNQLLRHAQQPKASENIKRKVSWP